MKHSRSNSTVSADPAPTKVPLPATLHEILCDHSPPFPKQEPMARLLLPFHHLAVLALLLVATNLFGLRGADTVTGFTGPFASERWALAAGAGFFGTDSLVVGVSSFGPDPSVADVSVTVPEPGTLTLTAELSITPGLTGLGSGGAEVLIDGQPAPWGGNSISLPLRANQRLTFRVVSHDSPIPWHPGSYGGGPAVSLRLSGLVFTPNDPLLPPITATGLATVVNGFTVGVSVTEAGRSYTTRPGVRLVGGGGSGARAVAELFGDKVSRVRITNPGSGYAVEPLVLIDPPGGRTGGTIAAWGSDVVSESSGPNGLANVAQVWAGNRLTIAQTDEGQFKLWADPLLLRQTFPVFGTVTPVAAGDEFAVVVWQQSSFQFWGGKWIPDGWINWLSETPVTALAAGVYHVVALAGDGTVTARGDGPAAVVPPNLMGITAVAAGDFHSLALTTGGTVVAWGENDSGQTAVPAGLPPLAAIAAGGHHSLALTRDGQVMAWGDPGAATVPANLGRARAIAAGRRHSLALLEDGRVVAWGDNSEGQTNVPANLGRVTAIVAGGNHSVALHEPAAAVTIQAAIRLDFAWSAGRTYQLETSSDLGAWTAVGAPEVADGDTASKVVAATAGAAFFRLRQLP